MSEEEPFINLWSGERFFPLQPDLFHATIEDIAHALSLMPRFAGHNRAFYSVAQHSVEVSYGCDPKDALWGLLHDGSEAFLMDLPGPIKHLPQMEGYRALERDTQGAICARFGLLQEEPVSVRDADHSSERLQKEWQAEYAWTAIGSERAFLTRFAELMKERR